MNPRLRKELTLLAPAFGLALALAVLPALFLPVITNADNYHDLDTTSLISISFCLGMVVLAAAAFGREFNQRTFSLLLSQPVKRSQIWIEKTGVLCVLAVLVLLAFLGCGIILKRIHPGAELSFAGPSAVWVTLVAVAGGLWTAPFFRNAIASLWFIVLVPLTLAAFVNLITDQAINETTGGRILIVLYTVGAVAWSYWLFMTCEDTARFGQEISFRFRVGSGNEVSAAGQRSGPRGPVAALVRKELYLQQIPLLTLAAATAVLLAIAVTIRLLGHADEPHRYEWLSLGWTLMVLLMPPLIGSVAIAEERKLGTMDIHLSLPVSRAWQWTVKWVVIHGLSVLVFCLAGALLAIVLGWIAGPTAGLHNIRDQDFWGPLFWYTLAAATVSFYGSSLARTTLGALGIALGLTVVVFGLGMLANFPTQLAGNGLAFTWVGRAWGFWLFVYIAVPVMVIFLWRMSFNNFAGRTEPGRLWRRNVRAFFLTVAGICLTTTLVYHRVWELAEPLEPSHGPARLELSTPVQMGCGYNHAPFVLFPGGALDFVNWTDPRHPSHEDAGIVSAGSNWMTVAFTTWPVVGVGIQSDGSLWRLSDNPIGGKAIRLGSDTNWHSLAAGTRFFLALKNDGTLWQRAATNIGNIYRSEIETTTPVQIGTDTDWAAVFADNNRFLGVKRDASMWVWGTWPAKLNGQAQRFEMVKDPKRLDEAFNGPWLSLSGNYGVRFDGSLWLWSGAVYGPDRVPPLRIGHDSDWKNAGVALGVLYALKDNGTLWRFGRAWRVVSTDQPVRLSKYTDWVSLTTSPVVTVLARDGAVYRWDYHQGLPEVGVGPDLLGPSREPLRLGNVIDTPR